MAIPSMGDIRALTATLTDLVKKGMTLEAQEKIVELREIIIELREQNVELSEEILELKNNLKNQDDLIFEDDMYWKKSADKTLEGPFCQPCFDDKGKLIRLAKSKTHYLCRICRNAIQHTKSDLGRKQLRR